MRLIPDVILESKSKAESKVFLISEQPQQAHVMSL